MLFSFSGVFLTFVTILITCFLCRRNINKPLIDTESQFWSSFVEEKKDENSESYPLEQQKGKATLTTKNKFGSMKNRHGDIELAWSDWPTDISWKCFQNSCRIYCMLDKNYQDIESRIRTYYYYNPIIFQFIMYFNKIC